jgi:signal-transduction protein with cAMP-binding, CBS, and nucleotidyltransferase domain
MALRSHIRYPLGSAACIAAEQPVAVALRRIAINQQPVLIVIQDRRPVGLLTPAALLTCWRHDPNPDLDQLKVHQIMQIDMVTIDLSESLDAALTKLNQHGGDFLVVLEKRQAVGVLTADQLLRTERQQLKEEIETLQHYIDDMHEAQRD